MEYYSILNVDPELSSFRVTSRNKSNSWKNPSQVELIVCLLISVYAILGLTVVLF